MKKIIPVLFVLTTTTLWAQEVVPLWTGEAPYSKPNTLEEYVKESSYKVPCAYNVTKPTLTIHRALGTNSGRAMIVVPGGGYVEESIVAEGQEIAEALSAQGITAAVLKYRLPLKEASDQPHLLPITDARRAISMMKLMAGEYGFDPTKVGIMGFSAGGHLATAVSVLRSEEPGENPDFSAPIYPVTTLGAANQKWLEETLFHRPMTEEEIRLYSLVDHVDAETPPAFLAHAYDDDQVPIAESEVYAEALTAVGQEVEVHFFPRGGHGFGSGRVEDGTSQWLGLLADWIKRQ
jgi:acetyl esterase/lipase